MRIAGVVSSGKNRGDPIPLEPKQKVECAAKLGAILADQFDGFSVTVADLKVDSFTHQIRGKVLKTGKDWPNQNYRGTGTASIWLRDLVKDVVHHPRPFRWEVECHDELDEWKLPDVAVDKFTAVPL